MAFARPSAAAELRDALVQKYARHATLLDSGTSALSIALEVSRRTDSGPVALPAFGCFDLGTSLQTSGRRAILYDVSPITLGPDWDSLRAALRAGADTVVVAHLFGVPVDLALARSLADEYGATLIEDAAQGVGGLWQGRPLGAHGDFSILSFGRGKGLTGGSGGALLSHSDPRLPVLKPAGVVASLRGGIALVLQEVLSNPHLYGLPASLPFLGLGRTQYQKPKTPLLPMRWSPRVLLSALNSISAHAKCRQDISRYLSGTVSAAGLPELVLSTAGRPGWLRYPLVLPREAEFFRLPKHLGITRSYPMALDELGPLKEFVAVLGSVTGARTLAARLVTLPTHSHVSENDLLQMKQWIDTIRPQVL